MWPPRAPTTWGGYHRDRNDEERAAILDAGFDLDRILTRMVSGDNVFFTATRVTDGSLLRGVRLSHRIVTHSLCAGRSGTIRYIEVGTTRNGPFWSTLTKLMLSSSSPTWTCRPDRCPRPGCDEFGRRGNRLA